MKVLETAEQLIASRTDFFEMPVTKDEQLNARLAALGKFDSDSTRIPAS